MEASRPNKRNKTEHAERVMEYAFKELQSMSSETNITDEPHHVGQLVERHLHAMNTRQRAIAKKIIYEVLFYGNVEHVPQYTYRV